jgi:hypothetical protein
MKSGTLTRGSRAVRRGALALVAAVTIAVPVVAVVEPASAADSCSWGGYTNGSVPLGAMSVVSGNGASYYNWAPVGQQGDLGAIYLEPSAASKLTSMLVDYHAQTGDYLHPNEGYRNYAGQVYWSDKGGTTPGTSNHGCGVAVDFSFSGSQRNWVVANGPAYGYFPLAGDAVHFNYFGSTATPPPAAPAYPAASVVKMPNGTVAAASIDQFGSLFETNQTAAGAGFTPWTKLTNGGFTGAPAAIVAANGTLAIFGRTANSSYGLVAQSSVGSGFTNYGQIGVNGPAFASDPAVAMAPNNTLVVVGVGTDGRLWESNQTSVSSTFTAWTPIGADKVGRPAIIQASNGTMAVAVRSTNGSITLVAQQTAAGAFVDFGAIGVNGPVFASSPAMALAPNNTVVVTAVSNDGRLWETNQTSVTSTFTAWTPIASGKAGSPAMLQASNQTMAVAVRTASGAISLVAQSAVGGAFVDFGAISSAGTFVSDPVMTLEAAGTVGVIATDGTNNRFYTHQTSVSSTFTPWARL